MLYVMSSEKVVFEEVDQHLGSGIGFGVALLEVSYFTIVESKTPSSNYCSCYYEVEFCLHRWQQLTQLGTEA